MRAAPENFIKRVRDLDDIELRRKFVEDALKWAQGDQDVAASFKEYESSLRLRRVLREIKSFSPQFTDQALDAFVHLTAPPQPPPPPTPAPEPAKEAAIEKEVMRAAVPKGIRELAREGEAVAPGAPGQQVWGGLPFVRVPAGKFVMGSKDDNQLAFDQEKPQHTVEIPYDYWIARFPVTNEQVAEFVEIAKYKYNMASDWKDRANHPVVNVSWYDAMEYCKWLNEKLKAEIGDLEIRLPTEAEWEKAARGEFGNEWPWGNEFDAARCNSSEGGKRGTTPVGAYSPQGDSPCGAADMVGNVWEWCHSIFKPYPYKAGDGREQEPGTDVRVLRGGAFLNLWNFARAACRLRHGPGYRDDYLGFRVVVAPRLS
jgi:formylglycine-generating enzyme required for sulfatase activity